MTDEQDRAVEELIRAARSATGLGGPERDLWPRVRNCLDRPRGVRPSAIDWALVAIGLGWCLWSPETFAAVLYHF